MYEIQNTQNIDRNKAGAFGVCTCYWIRINLYLIYTVKIVVLHLIITFLYSFLLLYIPEKCKPLFMVNYLYYYYYLLLLLICFVVLIVSVFYLIVFELYI